MNDVLLVNDNIVDWISTAVLLQDLGWEVYVANDDEVLFKSIVKRRPAMVIVDIEMEGGVGFKAILTARLLFKKLFIIAITRGDDEDIWAESATNCGANAYIVGPMSTDKLSAAIQTGIGNGQLVSLPSPRSRQDTA